MTVLFRHQWLGAELYNADLAPGVCGFGDIGSAFSGSNTAFFGVPPEPVDWAIRDQTFFTNGRTLRCAEAPPVNNGYTANWIVRPGSKPTTATPAITGAWSARFYYRTSRTVDSTQDILTFRDGTTDLLKIQSRKYNGFNNWREIRGTTPGDGLFAGTGNLTNNGWFQRVEIQFDPDRTPSLVVRVYREDDTTGAKSFTLDPATCEWDNFRIGPSGNGTTSQQTQYWGHFEVHDDYDLGGQFTSNPTSPTAASTTATGVPSTNPTYPARFNIGAGSNETTANAPAGGFNSHTNLNYTDAGTFGRKLDLYTPSGTAPINGWPVVVWCHSGYFVEGDRTDIPMPWVHDLLSAGYAVATVEYVKSGYIGEDYGDLTGGEYKGGRYPSHILDLKRAGAWLRDNQSTYNIDPNKMISAGYSAGGYLALAALVTRNISQDSQGNYLKLSDAATNGDPWADGYTDPDPTFLGAVMYNAPINMDKAVEWDPGGPDAFPTIWIAMDAYMDSTANLFEPYSKPSDQPHTAVDAFLGITGALAVPTLYIRGTSDYLVHWEHVEAYETALNNLSVGHYLTIVDEPTIHKQEMYDKTVVIDWLDALTSGEGDAFEMQGPIQVSASMPSASTSDDDGIFDQLSPIAVTVKRAHSGGDLQITAGEFGPDGIHDQSSPLAITVAYARRNAGSLPATAEASGIGPIYDVPSPINISALVRQVNPYVNPPTIVPEAPGLGEDVLPPARWDVFLYEPLSTTPFARLNARAKSIDISLQDPSTAAFTVSGNDDTVNLVDEFVTDAIWAREGRHLVRCRIGGSVDTIDADKHEVTFSGADYRALLDRRWLTEAISTTGAADEQFDIAWDMIAQTQATEGGDLGLTRYDLQSSGVDRADVWALGTQIATAITEMGNRRSADGDYGFDWDVNPDLTVRFWTPNRGTETGFTVEYGSNCDYVRRTVSSDDYANYVATQWTDKAGQEKLTVAVAEDLNVRPEGRWEYWEGGSWATTGEGNAYATGLLSKKQGILPSYEVRLLPGTWDPALCWVGDVIGLIVQTGRLNVRPPTGTYRVQRIKVDIDDSDIETVTLTLGSPAYKLATRLWNLGRSVRTLERR